MAGFFRRLAEQALLPTPQLRSAAAAPYAQTEQWGSEESEGLPSIDSLRPESTAGDLPRELESDNRLRVASGMATSPEVEPVEEASRPAPARRHNKPTNIEAATPRVPWISDTQDASARDMRPMEPPAKPTPSRTTTLEHPIGNGVQKPPHRSSPLRPETSQLRITPAATPRASQPQLQPDLTTRIPTAGTDSAPEVHIHIGRIELTAVSPPAAPRRESVSTKKPMSLDEYLQRRHRAKDGTGAP